MRRLVEILVARWFVTLIGALILALLIWFLGPLIAIAEYRPLEGEVARFVAVLVVMMVWGLANLWSQHKARQSNARMVGELGGGGGAGEVAVAAGAPAPSAEAVASDEEVALLRERLQEALDLLKKARLGGGRDRRYLYELPWYVIIGPPGSGKTTALVNSGLRFPLAERLGSDKVRGVGGTRHCDWWFTDEAVLIDTAGRYTTQDSHQAVDSASWLGFLDLLKRYRRRQPINGVLVAISPADLLSLGEGERFAHARAIRQRLNELYERLGVRFPVYVLFTKMDLVAGFIEFFDDLGREDREQVWGTTFPLDDGRGGEEGVVATFDGEFDALLRRLNERMLERLDREPDMERRRLIHAFPQQVSQFRELAADFLKEVFQPSRLDLRPLLRGVYFTSGTQEGTPIDRLMGAMASIFGLDQGAPLAFRGPGRGYFLSRLLRQVVFAEAGVVSSNLKIERIRFWLRTAAYSLTGLTAVGLTAAWLNSFAANQRHIETVNAGIATFAEQAQGRAVEKVADSDLKGILPPLGTLRAVAASHQGDVPIGMTFGLYQGDRLEPPSTHTYGRALNGLLLPRLLVRLEGQLRDNIARPDYLYEALKVYLMLGKQGKVDADLIRRWMHLDWETAFPGKVNEGVQASLKGHMDSLLEQRLADIPLDDHLIRSVRRTLLSLPLSTRAYIAIRDSEEARQLPDWRMAKVVGEDGKRVFRRRSGKRLAEGIPGFFTLEGYRKVFVPQLSGVTKRVAADSWVLGSEGEVGVAPAKIAGLVKQVQKRYFDDYVSRWRGLVDDVIIVKIKGLDHAVQVLSILSRPRSPVRTFLQGVVAETKLTELPKELETAAAIAGAAKRQRSTSTRLARVMGAASQAGAGMVPGKIVEDSFQDLHDLVGEGGGGSPLASAIATLNDLYVELHDMAGARGQGTAALGSDGGAKVAAKVQRAATRLPPPVNGWLSAVAIESGGGIAKEIRKKLNKVWRADVLPLCNSALKDRFPVFKGSRDDMTLTDFGNLFAPGGLIDGFFNTYLKGHVDTTRRPWRLQNADIGIPAGVLAYFQQAAAIRDGLFAGGAKVPQVEFEVVPIYLDAKATQVRLVVDGQTLSYRHGPPRPVRMRWPGPKGPAEVRLSFAPLGQGANSISRKGPWAWFRILGESAVAGDSRPDRFKVTFKVGGRTATFEVRANSVINPFTLKELERFRCPDKL